MAGAGGKRQLGKILLRRKLLTPAQLTELEKTKGRDLQTAAVESGRVPKKDLLEALSEQTQVSAVDLSVLAVDLATLRWIPEPVARQHSVFAFFEDKGTLWVAMANPRDKKIIEELEFVTGKQVKPFVALTPVLLETIAEAYHALNAGKSVFSGSDSSNTARAITKRSEFPDRSLIMPPMATVDAIQTLESPRFSHSQVPLFESEKDAARPILVSIADPILRQKIITPLQQRGYQVAEGHDLTEAASIVSDRTPRAVIVDFSDPRMGLTFCRRMHRTKRASTVPAIVIVPIGWKIHERIGGAYGVSSFITPPEEPLELLSALERALLDTPTRSTANKKKRIRDILEDGMRHFQQGQTEQAIHFLMKGLAIDPMNFQLYYKLGLLYGQLDRLEEAIAALEDAAELNPDDYSTLKNLAVLYEKVGLTEKALSLWEHAMIATDNETTRGEIQQHILTKLLKN